MQKRLKRIFPVLRKLFGKTWIFSVSRKAFLAQLERRKEKMLRPYMDRDNWVFDYRGIKMEFSTTDIYSKGWFYPRYDGGKIHEPQTTEAFIDHVKKDSIVLDVGSHLGYYACLSGKIAEQGKVHAFEVDPKGLELLERNVELNRLNNIVIHHVAVSGRNGIERFPVLDNPNAGLGKNVQSDEYFEVPSVKLDDFVKKEGIQPDFIKIDVEGAELEVLKGMSDILDYPDINLLVEIHPPKLKRLFNSNYKDVLAILDNKGFKMTNIDHRERTGISSPVTMETELKSNTMVFCTRLDTAE